MHSIPHVHRLLIIACTLIVSAHLEPAAAAAARGEPSLHLRADWYRIVDPFFYDESRRYEGGWNRGADVTTPDGVLRAPTTGIVQFSGTVAGRGILTVSARIAGMPVVLTFTGVGRTNLQRGDRVHVGEAIAASSNVHVGAYDPQRRTHYLPVLGGAYAVTHEGTGSSDDAVGSRVVPGRSPVADEVAQRLLDAIEGHSEGMELTGGRTIHPIGAKGALAGFGPGNQQMARITAARIDAASIAAAPAAPSGSVTGDWAGDLDAVRVLVRGLAFGASATLQASRESRTTARSDGSIDVMGAPDRSPRRGALAASALGDDTGSRGINSVLRTSGSIAAISGHGRLRGSKSKLDLGVSGHAGEKSGAAERLPTMPSTRRFLDVRDVPRLGAAGAGAAPPVRLGGDPSRVGGPRSIGPVPTFSATRLGGGAVAEASPASMAGPHLSRRAPPDRVQFEGVRSRAGGSASSSSPSGRSVSRALALVGMPIALILLGSLVRWRRRRTAKQCPRRSIAAPLPVLLPPMITQVGVPLRIDESSAPNRRPVAWSDQGWDPESRAPSPCRDRRAPEHA